MLSFDIVNFVCVVVNLIVLYILMKKFVFGRVSKILDARQQMIDEKNAEAGRVRTEAEELKKEYEINLANAKETSDRIVREARDRAKTEYNKILDRAAGDADAMKASAMKAIEMEKEKEMEELHSQIMDLAVEAAGKIMYANSGKESDNDLYDAFLKEAGDAR